jgi:molybdopterin converting factor small subunit
MRVITGTASLEINHANARTLLELLFRLLELFPGLHQKLLDEQGHLYQDLPIFVNGRNPRLTNAGINSPLEPDDVVTLFSPISSGRMNVEVMRIPPIAEQELI